MTVDSTGTTENQIRIELVVYDSAGKFSERHRMYFVVVPDGFGDEEPDVQWNDVNLDGTQFLEDNITLTGKVLSGSETGEVYVEVAFYLENLSASAAIKYQLSLEDLWAKSSNLSDGDTFELTLDTRSFYALEPTKLKVYLKYYEGTYPNERWVTTKSIELTLPACQGLEADQRAIEAGGEFA